MQMDKLASSDDGLRDDLHSICIRLDDVAKEMRMVSAQTGSFIASQDVVNRVTSRALESLETKLEKLIGDYARRDSLSLGEVFILTRFMKLALEINSYKLLGELFIQAMEVSPLIQESEQEKS